MSVVITTPEVAPIAEQWPDPPRLLVEWSSPWDEFKSALGPALARAPKALAGEAPIGIFPYRGILISWLLECLLLIAVIVLPERFVSLEIPAPPTRPQWDVIYYSGDELPQTQDRGGAQSGKSGRAGGEQAHHRTQAIRVARGDKPSEKIVDAPQVNLPRSDSAVANLLAFKPTPGPPPSEGLRSSLIAPALPTVAPVAPTPELNSDLKARNANSLTPSIIPPAPDVSHSTSRTSPTLNAAVIPPAPDAARDKMRTANPLAQTVVAPAPRDTPRDLASSRTPITQTIEVVPPPVSAPQRDVSSTHKLTLPAPVVVAPPPSQVSRDLNSWGATATGDLRAKPVPPPPSASGGGSLGRSAAATLTPQVVPPPASIDGSGANPGAAGKSASRSAGSVLGSAEVVPPPPTLGGGKALAGSGRGNKGAGAGAQLDLGSPLAPPANAGNAAGNGVVISAQPGTKVGLPNQTDTGAIAMSPSGNAKTGLGGSGGGASIGKGNGPGSGLQAEGSGAGREGAGRGSDPNAHAGISPYPGQGGAGTGTTGTPAMPGVSVQGGTTTITLPSFGSPGGDASSGPGRSSASTHQGSGITIEATPRSGGVFNYYGVLKGDRNYSIYIETSLGTAVMQYADPASASHPSGQALSAPEPMRKDLPQGLRSTHVVIACTLDRSGDLKDLKVLEPGAAETTSKILVALHNWKFRPAFRGDDPVEVNAIIGFGIDTR
ncbi:MAG TPA: hypothetical protein VK828_18440 [Terriglobales bacterium]|jgi:hypothetical protein|nr:hypothetical protein [Terriglobales bacterium]